MSGSVRAYVALGSNLGDREAALARAARALAGSAGIALGACSRLYETAPVGPPQGPYLNAVVACDTTLAPARLLARLHELEREAGRVREEEVRWGPRVLDLDLLLYGEEVLDLPGLSLPHPRLHERGFVLEPLCELAPALEVPGRGRVDALAARVRDAEAVRVYGADGSQEGGARWPSSP